MEALLSSGARNPNLMKEPFSKHVKLETTRLFCLILSPYMKNCSILESQIEYCQSKNIGVILSIGQDVSQTTSQTRTPVKSVEAAEKLAEFLSKKYLSSQSGPLGNVALDGINIFEVSDGETLHWDEIVKAINKYSTTERKIYLSASPQCVDAYLGDAIATGLIDYAFVEFYYDPTYEYDSINHDATKLLLSWEDWISKEGLTDKQVFMGLLASTEITGGNGYVKPGNLTNDTLPVLKQAPNYGGILLFDRAADNKLSPLSYNERKINYLWL